MKSDHLIQKALSELADNAFPQEIDIWSPVSALLKRRSRPITMLPARRLSTSLAMTLAAIVAITIAVYAFYRIMIDPGLQGVQDSGLVTEFNQPAQPTLFPANRNQSIPTLKDWSSATQSETNQDIQIKLNWAYADEARIAMQFTVLGLNAAQSQNVPGFICKPLIRNDLNVHVTANLIDVEQHRDTTGNPVDLTYIAYQNIDASQHEQINLSVDLTLGACGPYWNFPENNLPAQTPSPLIGNFHFNFQTPVHQGKRLIHNQQVNTHNIQMRLAEVRLNPSYVDVRLCYKIPLSITHQFGKNLAWRLEDVTLQLQDGAPVPLDQILDGPKLNEKDELCTTLGYAIPSHPDQKNPRLRIEVLRIIADEDAYNLSPEFKENARKQLASQGITIDFETMSKDNVTPWEITQLPSGMTREAADQEVRALLRQVVDGPWTFKLQ